MSPFDISTLTFQRVTLLGADNAERDWHFDGALLGQSQDAQYDYFLYHTASDDPNQWMIGARVDKQTGKTEAETWGMIDIDMMATFFSPSARFDIFTQCHFPGYQYLGSALKGEGEA